ncbi:MAG TPA: glycosyltransferase [Gemmatimonadaceae bacterium]|nr:glycosyltransferase [Gemmatimonadaceae bacterium]
MSVRLSVVIPTYNRPDELARCVAAIAASTVAPERYEVIVVNDGGVSPDAALLGVARRLNLRVLTQPNRGPGAARNYGAGSARGELIAFTDDDCIPASGWLEALERSFNSRPESLHGGRTVNSLGDNPFSQASQSLIDYVHRYYNDRSARRTRFFPSNNIAVSARMFEATGGFDESLRAAEDRDFCRTWHNLGRDFQYIPDAVVNHAHHLTFGSLQRQHFSYGRGALPYWRKASGKNWSSLKVEPLSFYIGMLTHPFTENVPNPALIAALIVVSQISNAMGFAYEAVGSHRSPEGLVDAQTNDQAIEVPSLS